MEKKKERREWNPKEGRINREAYLFYEAISDSNVEGISAARCDEG